MAIRSGRFRGTLSDPKMSLPYLVILARATYANTGGTSPKSTWTTYEVPIRCDAYPLSDELIFLQAGAENTSTIVFHFYYNQDVRVRDRVQLQFIDSIVGDPGAWFELQRIERPHDILSYIRAHARVTDQPPQ